MGRGIPLRPAVDAALVVLLAAPSTWAALPGRVVARWGAAGSTQVAAEIERPRALYLRTVGRVRSGFVRVICTRGSVSRQRVYAHHRAGLLELPLVPARPGSCAVFAGIDGSGRILIEIRAVGGKRLS